MYPAEKATPGMGNHAKELIRALLQPFFAKVPVPRLRILLKKKAPLYRVTQAATARVMILPRPSVINSMKRGTSGRKSNLSRRGSPSKSEKEITEYTPQAMITSTA